MERFVVRAELRSPFLGNPVTLDGLLAAVLFQRLGSVDAAHAEIPLRQTQGLWHASSALFEDAKPDERVMTAALRASHDLPPQLVARGRSGRLPRLSEKRRREYGNVQRTLSGYAAAAVWWFGEGDPEAVRDLFTDLLFVGKKHTSGYGELGLIDIEPAGTTNGCADPAGQPLRPIPLRLFDGDRSAIQAEAAWRPAYWKIEHRDRCVVPATHAWSRDTLEDLL